MIENLNNEMSRNSANESVKELANALKKVNIGAGDIELPGVDGNSNYSEKGTEFKVASNLPVKTSAWTKIKNALFYEIKVELTPKQQKIEDDINEFLHQEITWESFKSFLSKEVPITYKGKRVF